MSLDYKVRDDSTRDNGTCRFVDESTGLEFGPMFDSEREARDFRKFCADRGHDVFDGAGTDWCDDAIDAMRELYDYVLRKDREGDHAHERAQEANP